MTWQIGSLRLKDHRNSFTGFGPEEERLTFYEKHPTPVLFLLTSVQL